jgi:DNA-binding SARP family transcriptional activator
MDIRIYSLGRFSIVKKGKPIPLTLKGQSKPILVLKVLIAFGGLEVKKEKISDVIWPDADGDMANQSLATTLHRLRKILDVDEAITFAGGTMTLNPNICWVDVWEFERRCEQSDDMWSRNLHENIFDNINNNILEAVSLYKGPFLPEEADQPWTLFLREKLRSKYLRAIGKIGHYYEQSGLTQKAVECFQRTLEIDNLDEEAYRRLMACYFRMGERSKALSVYDSCKRVLYEGLGVSLSRETEILRRSILMSEQ